jgi:hypothetical protein
VCGLRMFAVKNSRKRIEARSPPANYIAYALRFNAPEVVMAVAEGLRKAGLPEK